MATKPVTVNAQHAPTAPEYPYQPVTVDRSSSLASSPKPAASAVKLTLRIKKQR